MADTSSIKKDVFINFRRAVCVVMDFQHVNPGKGNAFVRTKLKDVQTGKTLDHTFKIGEKVDIVEMDRAMMQFLYKDDFGYHFMDNDTFEQVSLGKDLVDEKGRFLKEGTEVTVMSHAGSALSVELPKKIKLAVTESMPAVKGDTASGNVTKEVTLETGMKLNVPLFIEQGDEVIVNTETGTYVERAK